jgi:peptidyl-prolyl cis-trans isomerase C
MDYFRLKLSFQIVTIIAIIFSFSSCRVFNHSEEDVVISLGSRNITKAELQEDIDKITVEMGIHDQEISQGIKSIINKIVEKNLIMEYGKEVGIEISNDELSSSIKDLTKDYPDEAFKEMLLKGSVDYNTWEKDFGQKLFIEKITQKAIGDTEPITFDETQAYYNAHMDDFRHPMMVRLRQIAVQTTEEAEKILARLASGEDMGKLAEKNSVTPDAENGGSMGWIEKGQLEEDIEDIIFSLPAGKRSNILKSSYGYHIFEVMESRGEGYYSLPEAMEEIEEKLTLQKRELSYSKWISDLKNRYPVKIQEDIYTSWDK